MDRNEITIETPMIHMNLVKKKRVKEIHESFVQSFIMFKIFLQEKGNRKEESKRTCKVYIHYVLRLKMLISEKA